MPDDSTSDDLTKRLQVLTALLAPADADLPASARIPLGGRFTAPSHPCKQLLAVARACMAAVQGASAGQGLFRRLLTTRSQRRRDLARTGAAAGALLIEAALDRLGYVGMESAPTGSREAGASLLELVTPLLQSSGLEVPAVLTLAARVVRHAHSPWGGREYDIYLTRSDLAASLAFSITGPRGSAWTSDAAPWPELILHDAGDIKVETDVRLQFDVSTAPEGVNLLYHDDETLDAIRQGKTPDAVGQATFGNARLARGQAAFRMTHRAGHTIEQPLIPHLIRVHYQTDAGNWSR